MKKFTKTILMTASLLAGISLNANAADTNSQTLNIDVNKTDSMRISNLNDFVFGAQFILWGQNRVATDDICVYSTTGNYYLTATGQNSNGNQFRTADGAGNFIDYDVEWNANGGFQAINSGVRTAELSGADATNELCSGGTNTQIRITVNFWDFLFGAQGIYQDVITVLLEAQ